MAKLPRVTAKIFASNAASDDIGQFGSALSGTKVTTGDISVIQALEAYETGWRAAVISDRNYPTLQEMNGVQKTFSQQIAYLLQQGVPEWDNATTYYANNFCSKDGKLYISKTDENLNNDPENDSTNWEEFTSGTSGASGLSIFDIVPKDHILTFEESKGFSQLGDYVYKDAVMGSRYGYPDFYAKCLDEYQDPNNTTETVGGVTITINANGHRFYDIADKSAIDTIYNDTGIAWYYGIDTTSERILLPRNDYYFKNGNTNNVGEYQKPTLPNVSGNIYGVCTSASAAVATGFFEQTGSSTQQLNASGAAVNYRTYKANPSRSSSIYQDGATVNVPSVNLIPYMVVGNSETSSSIIDVVDITTSENDTTPLFKGAYFDFTPNNPAWLLAGGQVNSGGIYQTAYNELVNELSSPKYGLKVIRTSDIVPGIDYSEYWQVNQDDEYFICPTKISYSAFNGQVAGNGMTLGINNGASNGFGLVGYVTSGNQMLQARNDIVGTPAGTITTSNVNSGSLNSLGVSTDPTTSGLKAIESSTAKLYFKVANAVENLELMDVGEVMEAVNGVIPNNSSVIAAYAMPSNKYINLTLGASGATYTAPANGYIYWAQRLPANNGMWVHVNDNQNQYLYGESTATPATSGITIFLPVMKGYSWSTNYTGGTVDAYRFIYAQGSESEA